MTYPHRFTLPRPLRCMGALALAASLAACGGSDSDSNDAGDPLKPQAPVATELFGTAAVGAPIAGGKVEVRCQGGSTVLTTTTAATGAWQLDTTGQTLPCAVRVTGGSLAQGLAYHSLALTFGTLNITPLTDLIVANAAAQAPAAWWGGSGPADPAAITQAALDRALAALRAAFGLAALQDVDPRTAQFIAQPKDKIDDTLEALRLALQQAGMDYVALVQAALGQGFVLPESFRTVLASSYATVTTGSSTPDPVVPGPGTTPDPVVPGPGTTPDPVVPGPGTTPDPVVPGPGTTPDPVVPGPGTTPGPVVPGPGTTPDPVVPGPGGSYTLTLNVTASGVAMAPITMLNMPKPDSQAEFCGWVNDPSSPQSLSQASNGATGTLVINSCAFNGTEGQVSATMTITSPITMTVPYSVRYTYR